MTAAPSILVGCIAGLERLKGTGERALEQLDDAQFHERINPHQNSVAVIVQHLAGNMISRWTDLLSSDGEKPGRDREGEFRDRQLGRAEIMSLWERGWATLFTTLRTLNETDLLRIVHVRNEPMTVFEAIFRQATHYGTHVGQIMLIGKHLRGERWKYLTIPPGGSAAYNAEKGIGGAGATTVT